MLQRGIGADDLGQIEREQFTYFLTVAWVLGDPSDWPTFRRQLLGALAAAWVLDAHDRSAVTPTGRTVGRQRAVSRLLDQVRRRYDPAGNWAGFVLELWERRAQVRSAWDLPWPSAGPSVTCRTGSR